ncbi:hypothetical protein JVT61DRAFT_4068 [Boletus reticuloceps]|uniref:F-box domain-containing protein n=1 Tax=Boletus reticuloceps TaxID=495285 RepID=A0A8I2YMP7_9AGAM|nr:hypothetical protein JVT61DRAFT_4068 [Boletus reticuloceps]
MSDSTALSLSQLPPEVLHVIFHYLDIPDILRIRRVSRYLNGISHSRQVWTNAYRTAEFVRPPGPFLWQSTYLVFASIGTSSNMVLLKRKYRRAS